MLQLSSSTNHKFKLLIAISNETGSIEAIAFSYVAEELVEQSAFLTSQNMKVDAYEHVVALDKAIRKTKLFTIGVSATATSALLIKYVIKKIFDVDPSSISIKLQDVQAIKITNKATSSGAQTPTETSSALVTIEKEANIAEKSSRNFHTKRVLTFDEDKEKFAAYNVKTSVTIQKWPKPSVPDETSQDQVNHHENQTIAYPET